MKSLSRLSSLIARVLAVISAAAVILMMLHISLDVLLRNTLSISMNITAEMVARFYMVAAAFLPLAWIERQRAMVSVEVVEFALTAKVRWFSDLMVGLLSAAVYLTLAYITWEKAIKEMNAGAFVEFVRFNLPIWQSYFLPPLGFGLAAFVTLVFALELLARPGKMPEGYHRS